MGTHDSVRSAEMVIRRCDGETLQEIATAYGVSRERVRQLLKRAGVETLKRRPRGFVPFDKQEFERQRTTARVLRGKAMRRSLQRHKGWRRQAVQDLKALATTLGRTPHYGDLATLYRVQETWCVHRLGGRWLGRSHSKRARGMHRWYRLAGLTPWPTGFSPTLHNMRHRRTTSEVQ